MITFIIATVVVGAVLTLIIPPLNGGCPEDFTVLDESLKA